jgi:hypothetical protein
MSNTNNQYKINYALYGVKVNGETDFDKTVEKFSRELSAHLELQTKDQPRIVAALDALFVGPDTNLQKVATVTMVLSKIGFTTETYASLKERIENVIDTNERYYTVKGKGGGLRRMSDAQLATFKATGKTPDVVAREAKAEAEKASKAK